jgi:hypothetical protein
LKSNPKAQTIIVEQKITLICQRRPGFFYPGQKGVLLAQVLGFFFILRGGGILGELGRFREGLLFL